jgi:hypothetical protein
MLSNNYSKSDMGQETRIAKKADFMGNQEGTTCFNCSEFDGHKGCCKRANQLKPCIKQNTDISAI